MSSPILESFLQSIDPTAVIAHTGRIGIAIGEAQVIRFGSKTDIEREIAKREQLPEALQSYCPKLYGIHSYADGLALCESKHEASSDSSQVLRQWLELRKDLWAIEPWTGTIEAALKQVRPYRSIDFSHWSEALKAHKKRGAEIPISVQAHKLKKYCRKECALHWHRGWVHGALNARRIRKGVFLSWRHARGDGLRGEDVACWLRPQAETPADILIHIIKANWQDRPLIAAQALAILVQSQAAELQAASGCHVSISAHSGLSADSLSTILGCENGSQPIWKAARAKYRARNLRLGGVDVLVQTVPDVSPKRDDGFFLVRQRRPEDLFSRFMEGVQLDTEGRYSLTPERHALAIAARFKAKNAVLDACCGCGGNAIAFARLGLSVLAVDSDASRLAMAKHNAAIYGVDNRISFVHGSFQAQNTRAECIFLDPPWALSEAEILEWWHWAESRFQSGAIKLPKDFPVPQDRRMAVFCTEEGYPSFILVYWGFES